MHDLAALRARLAPDPIPRERTRALHEVRRSAVDRRGVYARRDLPLGEPVLTFTGDLVAAATVPDHLHALQVGPALWLVTPPGSEDIEDYVNHGCAPNLGFIDGTLTLRALRPIRAGEELLWDYATAIDEPGWGFECRCGALACRGRVAAFSALAPEGRDRLRPLALAYLRDLP